ncbi:aspartate aminotransferase family protein [Achromobacter pestifer]|uniref:Taurine--pyruvate aminotransferase n=1 Tax=Achromobacter pestifer TaxID=1353889 RepID=A0A6S6YS41_9BURK|nr:aminotransferase class III-fold pyridoxal phosphate-dependent enzyme [Achromobacter pestifer]CAB3639547.1 Taurine--pyruvate aminotransferase [Achromobacter pestifer]
MNLPMSNAEDAAAVRTADLIARRQRLLGPAYRLFYESPVHLVRGEGVWLYDAQGKPYLDAYNNVVPLGHCHPGVVEAITRQASILNTHTRYVHETVLDYAEALLATFPAGLGQVMFTCTGSEANDLALRIAQGHTGATGLIVTRFAYHGVTLSIAQASPSLGRYATLGPAVRTVAAPDTYRQGAAAVGPALAQAVREAIADLARQGLRPAALLVDTIFSSDGVQAAPAGFLGEAVDAVRAAGGLFIADEVQAGMGRTGQAMWGFMRHGVAPDLVTMGKPLGNGHPVAGVAARADVLEAFGRNGRYFNTFGGNPVSAAAGLAVLRAVQGERLMENAEQVGAYLQDGLRGLAARHDIIGDVRGAGLFIGVELVRDRRSREPATEEAARIVNGLRDRQVLTGSAGEHANTLKIRPPLPFSKADADRLLAALDETLAVL